MKHSVAIIALSAAALFAACSDEKHDIYAEIASDTSWSGAFDNRTVDGAGSKTVDLPDGDIECVVVQKETETGYLTLTIVDHVTGGGIMGVGEKDETNRSNGVSTTAAYGVVSGCNK